MARQQEVTPVKLFCGILFSNKELLTIALKKLSDKWGVIDYKSDEFVFANNHEYYKNEIKGEIKRIFISFENLVEPENISKIKEHSNYIEDEFTKQFPLERPINIDPGYMDYNKVILASYKYGQQKIAVGSGVWADITLFYAKGGFTSFPWTFPDFQTDLYYPALIKIRELYKQNLKTPK